MYDQGELKKIPGIKIRRQYFIECLYWGIILFGMALMAICLFGSHSIEDIKYILLCGLVFLIIILPVFLNRFFFGQVICVINEEGVYYYHGFIEWKAIEDVEFDIEMKGRYAPTATNIHIIGKSKKSHILYNMPYFAIRIMKRYKESIQRSFTGRGKRILIISSVFAGVLIFLPLFLFLLNVFS